jgi:RNA-binding protein
MALDPETPAAPELTGRQRKALRGMAHGLEPLVHVGAAGVTDAVLRAVDAALLAHDLVQDRLHAPESKQDDAAALAAGTGAVLCGLIGHVVILYRPHPEKPKIVVP